MHFRFPSFFFVLFALLGCLRALGQNDLPPFAVSPVATFHFSEIVNETLNSDGDSVYKGGLHVRGRVSMAGIDLNAIDEDTIFLISVETSQLDRPDLYLETPLSGGSEIDDVGEVIAGSIESRTLTFQINSQDSDRENGDGTLKITWDATELNYSLDLTDASEDFSILAQALADELAEEDEFEDIATLDVVFADRELSFRTIYVTGSAKVIYDRDDNPLARVNISGDIDSTAPKVAITSPKARESINEKPFTVRGTASDEHLSSVTVKVNDSAPEEATISGGTWSLPGVILKVGANTLVATASDSEGNEVSTAVRNFTYLPVSDLTVGAAGSGSGEVTASYFTPLFYVGMGSPETRTAGSRKEDEKITLTATAKLGSIFDGWTSVPPFFPGEDPTAAKLVFKMQPHQVVTAHFAAVPFLGKRGSFAGLVLPNAAGDLRGFAALKLTNSGTFTGSIKVGSLTIPVKGTLSNGLKFSGTFTVARVPYAVTLMLSSLPDGTKRLTGTVKGGAIDSTISADLATFVKNTHPSPQVGTYNVLLPAVTPAPANYPVGIGYGRITVSVTGLAKFVGKLGDGTAVSCGAVISEGGAWPFFAAVYGKKGSISGEVTFDLTNPDHDLAGTLDWFRPTPARPSGVHGDGFGFGQSQIVGALYPKPAVGRTFLNPTDGAGILTLEAPVAHLRNHPDLPAFISDPINVSVDAANKVTFPDAPAPAPAPLGLKVTISRATGLFTGSFKDPAQNNKSISFSGAIVAGKEPVNAPKINAAGGLFVRGDRTGAVQITAAAPADN